MRNMEGGHDEVVGMPTTTLSGGGSTPATSRWNPTKEQITMLENMYRQGIRTPTAEQIQEITGRLQAYGHIEGKNVFYWFQNHKARQRQKQKQENTNFAFLHHRYLHHHQSVPHLFSPPPPPHPCPNVVCGPYYVPQPELGFYSHPYPKVLLPGNGIKKRSPARNVQIPQPYGGFNAMLQSNSAGSGYTKEMVEQFIDGRSTSQLLNSHDGRDQETLELFPMHPTGILNARATDHQSPTFSSFSETSNITAAASPSGICMSNVADRCSGTEQLYFDFFTGK